MTLVVGYAPDGRGTAVLHLAGMLARSAHDDLLVCAVVASPWPPGPAQIDSEYRRFLDGMAQAALERARERLPGDVAASCLVHHARSAPAGLLEVAERREAAMIVVGTPGTPRSAPSPPASCTARRCRSRSRRTGSGRGPAPAWHG